MTRRTRRNLSDKRIRKIVQKQLNTRKTDEKSSALPGLFQKISLFLGIVLALFILHNLFNLIDVSAFFPLKSSRPAAKISKPIANRQPVKKPAIPPVKADSTPAKPRIIKPVPPKPQIEILNGCGVAGIARVATEYCRKNDLDVVSMGNYKSYNVKKSKIISWNNDRDTALQIARIIGIEAKNVEMRINKSKQLAASVILGADYKSLKPFKK